MNTLLVLLGPTGVGKTVGSIRIAEKLSSPILSADSRQLYKGMPIGTAAPTPDQLSRAKHYFVGILSPEEYYSASRYEEEAITLIEKLHKKHPVVVMVGGSMLYIDAVCQGIDEMPTIDDELRKDLQQLYRKEGLDPFANNSSYSIPFFIVR